MKIAIFGAGKCGEYVLQEIQAHCESKVEISVIIDNKPEYSGKTKFGIPIIALESFIASYHETVECVLITVWDELKAQEMAVSLLKSNYDNIYFIPKEVSGGALPILNQSGELISYIKHISSCKPVLPYVEYHVSDYCNLRCKGCGHFSNVVTEKEFPNIIEFRNEVGELAKRFKNIKKFRLMGGEPFVNPDIRFFLYEVRKGFPYADIRIVSNGLLIPQISDETVTAIRESGAIIDVSQYPPTRYMVENILLFAQKKDLKIQLESKIEKFFKNIKKSASVFSNETERIYSECLSRNCHFLRKGYLYVCGAPILRWENKDFLGLNIKKEDVDNASFDLINGKEDGWEILKKCLSPYDFCKYCTSTQYFEWDVSSKEIKREDWIV